jgi:uncharacterized protein with FMN-binding domain
MTERKNDKSTRLVALSSAAVLTVYAAGYMRTRAAAEKLSEPPPMRHPAVPIAIHGAPSTEAALPALQPASSPSEVSEKPARAAVAVGSKPEENPAAVASKTEAPNSAHAVTAEASPAMNAAPAPLVAMAPAAEALPMTGQVAQLSAAPPAPKWKDGTYSGWGTCRHGDIEATVTVAAGKITSARVSQCYTRYSCSWIDPIVPQVVARQSPETDYVSGATQSTYAFYYAVIEALSKAKP